MSCVCICRVKAFVMLYEDENVMFAGFDMQRLMMYKKLHGGLGEERV